MECYTIVVSREPISRADSTLPLREPWPRSCWDAARADNRHATAIEAMNLQFARNCSVGDRLRRTTEMLKKVQQAC